MANDDDNNNSGLSGEHNCRRCMMTDAGLTGWLAASAPFIHASFLFSHVYFFFLLFFTGCRLVVVSVVFSHLANQFARGKGMERH